MSVDDPHAARRRHKPSSAAPPERGGVPRASGPRVITCACGAQVRVAARAQRRAFRCPQCKIGIALTADGRALSASRTAAGTAACPICQSPLAEDPAVTCPGCDQVHHQECWAEVGGCGSYGCPHAPLLDKNDALAHAPRTAWGDTKHCPACGEEIKAVALRCRYCGEDFNTVDPLTVHDLRRRASQEESLTSLQKTVITIFVLSIFGPLAPLMLPVGLGVLVPRRRQLERCGPIYLVMAYAAVTLSLIFSLLMGTFYLAGL